MDREAKVHDNVAKRAHETNDTGREERAKQLAGIARRNADYTRGIAKAKDTKEIGKQVAKTVPGSKERETLIADGKAVAARSRANLSRERDYDNPLSDKSTKMHNKINDRATKEEAEDDWSDLY